MSQGTVGVVRRGLEAWGKGYLDALIAICDPAIDREGWRDFLSAWEGWQPHAEEYRELDGDRVLVLFQLRAHVGPSRCGSRPRGHPAPQVAHAATEARRGDAKGRASFFRGRSALACP